MAIRSLHPKAAYLTINNAAKRNALSLAVLRDLKAQIQNYNTSPVDGIPRFLPPFLPSILGRLEEIPKKTDDREGVSTKLASTDEYSLGTNDVKNSSSKNGIDRRTKDDQVENLKWLTSSQEWNLHRKNLPRALILRSDTDTDSSSNNNNTKKSSKVFSSGHDLSELQKLSQTEVKETFELCAQVMTLMRRSPIPIISVVTRNQLATAAGAQLALSADLPIVHATSRFQLPGLRIGVPCTSPATIFARKVGYPSTFRMLALAEAVRADELFGLGKGGAVEVVTSYNNYNNKNNNNNINNNNSSSDDTNDEALEDRVSEVINQIVDRSAGQPQALGKWAFWTQIGWHGASGGYRYERGGTTSSDGYEDALRWTARLMALHAKSDDAKEGIDAFLEKRRPSWMT